MGYRFRKVNTSSEMLNRVQNAVADAVDPLLRIPILDGRIVDKETNSIGQEIDIILSTTPKNVEHKLGRAYQGWFLIDKDANVNVWVDPPVAGVDPNVDRTKYLRLDASGSVIVKIWVF